MRLTRRGFGRGAVLAVALAGHGTRSKGHDGAHTHLVRVRDFTFVPGDLTVVQGDTVTWENTNLAPHTATARSARWDTGEIPGAKARSLRFTAPGEHQYFCAFHPQMAGRIRVMARS